MRMTQQVVFTAAALIALSGLAYSESSSDSIDELIETGTSSGSDMSSPAENAPAGTVKDMGLESAPGTGGNIERGDYPSGSPGGVMGSYSSAKKGGGMMFQDMGQKEMKP
jgi:hypothetical protein